MYLINVNGTTLATINKLSDALALGTFLYAQGNAVDVICDLTAEIVFNGRPGETPEFSDAIAYFL